MWSSAYVNSNDVIQVTRVDLHAHNAVIGHGSFDFVRTRRRRWWRHHVQKNWRCFAASEWRSVCVSDSDLCVDKIFQLHTCTCKKIIAHSRKLAEAFPVWMFGTFLRWRTQWRHCWGCGSAVSQDTRSSPCWTSRRRRLWSEKMSGTYTTMHKLFHFLIHWWSHFELGASQLVTATTSANFVHRENCSRNSLKLADILSQRHRVFRCLWRSNFQSHSCVSVNGKAGVCKTTGNCGLLFACILYVVLKIYWDFKYSNFAEKKACTAKSSSKKVAGMLMFTAERSTTETRIIIICMYFRCFCPIYASSSSGR